MIWRPHDLTRNSSSNLSPANPQHTISNLKVTAWSRMQLITQAMKYETSSKSYRTPLLASHWPDWVTWPHLSSKGARKWSVNSAWQCVRIKTRGPLQRKIRKWIQGSNLSHGIQGQNRLLDVSRVLSTFSSALLPSSYKILLSILLFTSRERDRERGRCTSGCFLNRGSTFPIQPRKCLLQLH